MVNLKCDFFKHIVCEVVCRLVNVTGTYFAQDGMAYDAHLRQSCQLQSQSTSFIQQLINSSYVSNNAHVVK